MKSTQPAVSFMIVLFAATMVVAEWELEWHSVDGGGAMLSTGGGFELSGTIGQSDAAEGAGGPFSLSGGFWFEHAPGDCVLDGTVTLHDVNSFQECAAGPDSPEVSVFCLCMDFDADGDVDLRDAAELQLVFSAP